MKKKLLSIALCLCMALSLLPTAALADGETAAPAATSVIVGGKTLDGTTNIYATTDSNGLVKLEGSESSYNIKFQNGVLTLKGATIAGVTLEYDGISAKNVAIYTSGALNLVLDGANTATCTGSSDNYSYGVYIDGDLTVSGGGSLAVAGAPTLTKNDSCGIKVKETLNISGGDITAIGNSAGGCSYGVFATDAVVMTGGSLTATSGAAKGFSYGIQSDNITISPSSTGEVQVTAKTTSATGTHCAFNRQPTIGDAVYSWKTAESGNATLSLTAAYDYTDKTYTELTLGRTVAAGKSQLGGVTYGKVNENWVEDVTSAGLDLTTPLTVSTAYTAGEGAIVWTPTLSGEPASVTGGTLTFTGASMTVSGEMETKVAVTLPNLTGGVKVVFKGENSITAHTYDSAYAFKCKGSTIFELSADSDTTISASGQNASAITNNLYGVLEGTAIEITGTGKLTVIAWGGGSAYAISAGARPVNLTSGSLDIPSFVSGTVTLGGVTIPADKTLDLSAAASVTKGDKGATIDGALRLKDGTTSAQINALGLTGSGTVQVGTYDELRVWTATDIYRYSGGSWKLAVPLTGIDLVAPNAPTSETVWQAGSGTVTYIPATTDPVANAQLIFDGAHMSVSPAEGDATAVTLPIAQTDVIFKGRNEISAVARTGNAMTFNAGANTTFTAQAGSKTTLNATGSNSKAIYSYGGDVTLTGTGELLLAPTTNEVAQKSNGYAIHAASKTVTIEGGITVYEPRVNTDSTTAVKNGTGGILAGTVNLGAATISEDGTLDLHGIDSIHNSTGMLVNNGTVILPSNMASHLLNLMPITGSGVVKIGNSYYKNVGGTWMTDVTYTGLDFTGSNAPDKETSYIAGEGTVTYTPGKDGNPPTLTLNNATIAPIANGEGNFMPPLTLGSAKLVLVGDSYLKGTGAPALSGANGSPAGNITIGGSGSLRLDGKSESLGSFGASSLTLTDTATVTSPGGTVSNAPDVGEKAKLNAILKVSGTRTVYGKNTIAEGVTQSYINEDLIWTDGARFVVNGALTLKQGTNFADVKDKLSGDGIVRIVMETDDYGGIKKWETYLTDGTILHTYKNLNFTILPASGGPKREDATLKDDGYTFTGSAEKGYVITLGNLDIYCGESASYALWLPADGKVEVKLTGDARVANTGTAMLFEKDAADYPCTISGSGSLRLTSVNACGLETYQPLTITGGTLSIATAGSIEPAIKAVGGLTLSGVYVASPGGAAVGRYGALTIYDTVLVGGKPAAGVSIEPVSDDVFYTLSFETNGGSAIAKTSQTDGTTIDLSAYNPTKTGYGFAGWYTDETLTEKAASVKLTKNLTVYAKWMAIPTFADVAAADWFYDDVAYVYEKGLMQGTGDTVFDPHGTTTRGMLVTILYRFEGESAVTGECPFDDVESGKYYEKAVIWAGANGIVDGYGDDRFGPEDDVTREQLAAILWRYAKYKGYDVSVGEDTNILSYNDAFDIAGYAIPAFQWACGAELVNGDAGNLMPQGNAERCQAAAILHRFCEKAAR